MFRERIIFAYLLQNLSAQATNFDIVIRMTVKPCKDCIGPDAVMVRCRWTETAADTTAAEVGPLRT